MMKGTTVIKRSVTLDGDRRTSISLEDVFWDALKDHAEKRKLPVGQLIGEINRARKAGSLSSALRVFVLEHAR